MRSPVVPARWLVGALLAALALTARAVTPDSGPPAPAAAPVERYIVKLRATGESAGQQAAPARITALAARHGLTLRESRPIVSGMHLMRVVPQRARQPEQTLARLRADPEVEYAEPDQRRYPLAAPDDTLFAQQWYEQDVEPSAVDAISAWDVTTGSPGLVIADLDTGVRFNHPDLRNSSANRLLPGYNLIASPAVANNGYGRGPDASDPGDWISASDIRNPEFASCTIANSTWHGTRVAGVLGAISDNRTGIAGVTFEGWVEPVRVLGKCGGYDSDIIAGMAWAAGNHVDGVPDNPYPARILNMSLGAAGSCPASYQQIIDELLTEGVLVVVSAGNAGGPVEAPANCAGVAAIAGLREIGTKVGYSSLGPEIALSAPAGNCVNTGVAQPCLYSIVTTTNRGTTVPATNTYTDEFNYNIGTSFAAPQVAAIAGLMLGVNGNLTSEQLIARLRSAARPFPFSASVPPCHVPASATDLQTNECNCTALTCGAGMANASTAVLEAQRPIAAIAAPPRFTPAAPVALDGSGSAAACNATIVSYQWTVLEPTTHPPAVENANSARATIVAPVAPTSYTLLLTVTDNQGRRDTAPVIVTPTSATTSAPAAVGDNACLSAVSYIVGAPAGSSGTSGGSNSATSGSAASGSSGSGGTGSGSGGSGGGSSSGGGGSSGPNGGGGGGGALDVATLVMLGAAALTDRVRRRYSSRWAASSHGRCARR
jgi:serine protease